MCPFIVIVDTREQIPYTFENIRSNKDEGNKIYIVKTERKKLEVGDYSIKNLESKITIERKSKGDLFQSVGKRDNFISRLVKMNKMSFSAVVIESSLEDVASSPPVYRKRLKDGTVVEKTSKVSPITVVRSIFSWDQQFNVKWWFNRDRRLAEKLTFRMLQTRYRHETQRVTRGPKTYDY